MFSEGINPIGDGLLDVDDERLKGLLVQDDINEIYDVEQTPFARGKFAAVRRAIHKKSGVHFAAKFLKRRRRAQSSDKEIKHEIAVLMMCAGSDNIVKLNAVHESRSDTALLLELATGGELQTFLDNEESLTEAQTRICMREVLKALQFLHKRSIAHLDLKPQNILLTGERIEDGLKLCDFGISRVVANGSNVREILGTPDYVAPEVLQYEPLSLQTDIWSVGVLTYVLLSGFSPFGGDTKQETFLNISQCALTFPEKLFKGLSVHATDFIRRALRIKPNDRMTASGCLEHIWLRDEMSVDRKILNISKAHDDLSSNGGGGSGGSGHSDYDEEDDDENSTSSSSSESSSNQGRNGMTNGTKKMMHNGATIRNGHTTSNCSIICSLSKQQQQHNGFQQLNHELMPSSRRHSSDANKENTFLRKPTSMSGGTSNGSSSTTTNNSSSISSKLNSSSGPAAINPIHQQQLQLTTTNGSATTPCLFPDAPTTPKVIRKAPTSESSPTSVKALVKKFQLESNSTNQQQPLAAPTLLLKEAHHNNNNNSDRKSNGYMSHHHHHNHHHQYNMSTSSSKYHIHNNSSSNRKSNGTTTTTQLKSATDAITTGVICTNGGQSTVVTTVSSEAAATSSSSMNNPSPSSSAALVTSNSGTYKTSCVFCLTCSGPGCRHSGTSVANKTTTNSIGLDQGIIC
ncbi:death-associated protein kinase related [Episyrphus balteatus]|uniref:death-associated protein kinase related n=1 Tax=Episyrphus balteatus TaxID=286459 RepID=UPI002485982B|nr:death-associated protein kinase related [Episyrphus balteatus]XP_055845135.1 death-associated protein kinase related [Episyrphus balteatus]